MELLVAGAVALAGYMTGAVGRRDRRRSLSPPRGPPPLRPADGLDADGQDDDGADFESGTRRFDREYEARAAHRWVASRDPGVTGIVDPTIPLGGHGQHYFKNAGASGEMPPVLPFFRSAKSQHTSDAVKQTMLETFTGAVGMGSSQTGVYRNKREVEAMFSPSYTAMPVTSSGSSGNGMMERQTGRYESGPIHNNVLPAEQLRVGRGVGVGVDVSAADGFHPMYRVRLENVNDYRNNPLPGGVIPGAHPQSGKPAEPGERTAVDKAGTLVYTQAERPMMPTEASVKAARLDQDILLRDSHRHINGARLGNPGYAAPKPGVAGGCSETRLHYEAGSDNPDRNAQLPVLNVTGARDGVGGFWYAPNAMHLRDQQREAEARHGHVSGPLARRMPSRRVSRTTQRALSCHAHEGWTGGVGRVVSGGRPRPFDRLPPTHRQSYGHKPVPLSGTKAAVHGGALHNVWRYKRLSRATARAGQLREYTPGAGRVNVVVPQASGAIALRDTAVRNPAAALPTVPGTHNADVGRSTSTYNKLPVDNNRLDLGVAVNQLQDNPYAQSLWTQR